MEALQMLEGAGFAQYFRSARWGYAALNASHILGIALLVGAIVPLDLRLLGFWRSVDRVHLVRVLVPTAAAGLSLAILSGFLLFSIRAGEYADMAVFRVKLALVLAGTIAALLAHLRHGFLLGRASDATLRRHALLSIVCWLGALACGRLIAFMGD